MDWIKATARAGGEPNDLPDDFRAYLREVFRLGTVEGLDAASRYMNERYGIGALDHPIHRARILPDSFGPNPE